MGKITATFERYFQYKAYEGEKIILTVEEDIGKDVDPVSAAAALHKRLAEIGDEITAKRLGQLQESAAKPRPPVLSQDRKDW